LDDDAEELIRKVPQADLVYVDADRRPGSRHIRVAGLAGMQPDIIRMKDRLLASGGAVLLKLSPMLDIHAIIDELKQVSEVYVVSLKNEVKELLVVMQQQAAAPPVKLHAVDISGAHSHQFSGFFGDQADISYGYRGSYFYEPALCLIKSGLSGHYAGERGLQLLAPNTQYFVSDSLAEEFLGRSFEIITMMNFSRSAVRQYLTMQGITQANIAKRNFPAEVDELKKLFLIKDGGNDYLFFTQNKERQKLMYHCRKIR
jgi:hypothetical protein